MKNWTIGKRLVIGFGVVLLVSAALGVYTVVRLTAIEKLAVSIRDEAVVGLAAFTDIKTIANTNAIRVLRIALSEDDAEIDILEKEIVATTVANDKLFSDYEPTIVQEEDRKLFAAVVKARGANSEARKQLVEFAKAHTAAETAIEYNRIMIDPQEAYLKAIEASTEFNKKLSIDYSSAITGEVASVRLWTILGVLGAILLGAGIAFVIVRAISTVLRDSVSALTVGSQQLVSAAGQVATSSQALSQGATEQAASLEETSASMEEMASMTRQNAENSQTAASLMGEVDHKVNGSNQALGDMVASMASIQESSQQVAKIIKTIDEIAFQTNILALNAAVEAARAGEAGMGFAVVADEVRNLAQRSAQAARDTTALIEESISKAQAGNVKVEQVAAAIAGITEGVSKVKGLVEEVSGASRQQSQGIDQVSQAIAQMEKVTQTTAATAEESAAASEELNAQAEGSMQVVGQLEMLVGGAAAAARPAAARPVAKSKTSARVLSMPAGRKAAAIPMDDDQPMGDTGTFGKF